MSANMVALAYLVASVFFILALKGLSSPESARRGNLFGMVGMAIAVATTLTLTQNWPLILGCIAVGGIIGALVAQRVQMTAMPELVAFMHSLVGLAAVFIAIAAVNNPVSFGLPEILPGGSKLELFLGTFIGAMTWSGSVIAFLKLSGRMSGTPIVFSGQHMINLLLAIAMIGFGLWFFFSETTNWNAFIAMTAIAFILGFLIIVPIGGADMPVVISMLNSYSGWAAAGIGFSLGNPMLIIAGSLVGSSGAILSYIMCKAMNRPFLSVILGGFGSDGGTAAAADDGVQKTYRSGSAEDAAFLMGNADSVIIVPGYGLAVARAQHAVKELAEKLHEKGVNVRFAIHPVAGRMPGHMNVLLAEAEIPYEQVLEMDEINSDFSNTDVVLVLGANDVVNPAANVPGSPIYGMPILDAHKARTVMVVKRSMAVGYAGLDNDLFYMDKTMMIFGDAKKVVEHLVKAL
ncbi:MAG: NAD(P)(+) transhydrogenase (Re/Si-specific) subunit beta [Nitrosomonas sp.]|jgi:NAD(P) transhydrogenase subunit beta|uniref:NAD(P)(+) transhydrogenase (Re/Si-specific) subunit beta n=1 Tax=Nitrosomonas sp. TaxID=42353 RepID=UPI001DD1169F|nr:NAD(P)(+) transhydrogenase (Re/Si-specific) subunit beta [Nitrosomonas sp.]MBK6958096.1 NAD(P)(+) transhydrogenase (Re/Si-specific) subunit beta [Nitrosomonas sp.]MBX9637472.1 NAD(P)(+) transhydrogenase (Re/Si-specific) subunit beta [Nitrosomonas sp.]MBY0484103.1 NAD(P)(+) transhydrogenase (Re/Si-specific) subunit beta [Nitrosomonas sp.]MDO8894515.1 NAD(P)(+) transhydrogenase (Re/Si-specific) subunit beta [Nitrosomonas sp.]MDO9312091.1 NAD(P)(+) transhydrogenase (Re/Si-specific) subunit bet